MKAEFLPADDDTIGLLTHLAEECNEVAKECMKAVRFGLDNAWPAGALTNAQKIESEYRDLELAMQRVRNLIERSANDDGLTTEQRECLGCLGTGEPHTCSMGSERSP